MRFVDQGFGQVKLIPETERDVRALRAEFPHLGAFEAVVTQHRPFFKVTLETILFGETKTV
jgi:hypothetical protein